MNSTLVLGLHDFWMLRGILERDIENQRELVASAERWASPALAAFRQGLEARERLLRDLDASHPHGAVAVAGYAATA